LAYTGDWDLRSVNVADPTHPVLLGTAFVFNTPEDMVVRDTLLYIAENSRLEIFSIANPRSPRLVGSLGLTSGVSGLCVSGGMAYIAGSSVFIVNITDPVHPSMEGQYNCDAVGVSVVDTILYVAAWHQGLRIVCVADPTNPREIAVCPIEGRAWDVVVANGTAYVGGTYLRLVDVRNPESPVEFGHYSPPDQIRRVFWQNDLLYAACFGAGVSIFETTGTVGIADTRPTQVTLRQLEVTPNPASSYLTIRKEVMQGTERRIEFYNAAGISVLGVPTTSVRGQRFLCQQVDISALLDGCYFVRVEPSVGDRGQKVIKTTRR
jgi:hypothetical protein